ncbi:hypothetical protein [Acuticoccus mangrovi]|uniref:Uncharacterized protein n=1 Tax=Acuticoccus mangrovi TaxID=2796142 RepID=A0A934IJD2_9HYPH|nr:hypothetical protein [Acuticoccus mangrovi]MBJ3777558.1 hypothetical protein [Acuticoccus mangrovi]
MSPHLRQALLGTLMATALWFVAFPLVAGEGSAAYVSVSHVVGTAIFAVLFFAFTLVVARLQR